jgi:hypothetical protein
MQTSGSCEGPTVIPRIRRAAEALGARPDRRSLPASAAVIVGSATAGLLPHGSARHGCSRWTKQGKAAPTELISQIGKLTAQPTAVRTGRETNRVGSDLSPGTLTTTTSPPRSRDASSATTKALVRAAAG